MLPKDVVTAYCRDFINELGSIDATSGPPWMRTRNTIPDATTCIVLQRTAPVQNKLTENTKSPQRAIPAFTIAYT